MIHGIKRWNNTRSTIVYLNYPVRIGFEWAFGINNIICLYNMIFCDTLPGKWTPLKFDLIDNTVFTWNRKHIRLRINEIFISFFVFNKILRKMCRFYRPIKAREAQLRTLFETVTWGYICHNYLPSTSNGKSSPSSSKYGFNSASMSLISLWSLRISAATSFRSISSSGSKVST